MPLYHIVMCGVATEELSPLEAAGEAGVSIAGGTRVSCELSCASFAPVGVAALPAVARELSPRRESTRETGALFGNRIGVTMNTSAARMTAKKTRRSI